MHVWLVIQFDNFGHMNFPVCAFTSREKAEAKFKDYNETRRQLYVDGDRSVVVGQNDEDTFVLKDTSSPISEPYRDLVRIVECELDTDIAVPSAVPYFVRSSATDWTFVDTNTRSITDTAYTF